VHLTHRRALHIQACTSHTQACIICISHTLVYRRYRKQSHRRAPHIWACTSYMGAHLTHGCAPHKSTTFETAYFNTATSDSQRQGVKEFTVQKESQKDYGKIIQFAGEMAQTLLGKRLFVSSTGHLGVSWKTIVAGDKIWLLKGASVPLFCKRVRTRRID
jgi:hypothetical protein